MRHTYIVKGMTCGGCKASVEKYVGELKEVNSVVVILEKDEVVINMNKHITVKKLQEALPVKYQISEKESEKIATSNIKSVEEKSKLEQLRPLLIILFYIMVASVLLHYKNWDWNEVMLDFMGLFYIVFSFFKMLDLKGFPDSFKMYDPLAKRLPVYGWVYPFIETILGLMFLMRFEINIALILTVLVLGITTVGVTKTLVDKKSIKCACLGTALKLPMTEATFIENTIMIVMAILMLLKVF